MNVVAFAAPVIAAFDVSEGEYFSYIVARPSANLDAPRVVFNNRFSHSGHTTIRLWLEARGITSYTSFESGSHAQSVASLHDGRADLAAIDALTWQHLETTGLDVLDTSEPAPAPPFIMGNESDVSVEDLTVALNAGFQRHGHKIGIGGVLPVSRSRYTEMANLADRFVT
jgi:ABC-type phosphate/phosphonate transport system substrate-binding protein